MLRLFATCLVVCCLPWVRIAWAQPQATDSAVSTPLGHTLKLPDVAGAFGPEEGRWRRQFFAVPGPDGALQRGVVFRPKGDGMFPLAVLSHGTSQEAEARAKYRLPYMLPVMEWLVGRGYVVAMMLRRGVGETGTPFAERLSGRCDLRTAADYLQSVGRAAEDIQALAAYMRTQPFVRAGPVLLVGHSGGGMASLAHAADKKSDVSAVINFGGARGSSQAPRPGTICNEPALNQAHRELGKSGRVPTLWIYADNDGFALPDQIRRRHEAFVSGGGLARLLVTDPIPENGHMLAFRRESRPLWQPTGDEFITSLPQ